MSDRPSILGRDELRNLPHNPCPAWRLATLFVAASLAACTVGPDYQKPPVTIPAAYKEEKGWTPSKPQDGAARGPWWAIYHDPVLAALEQQVEVSNQNLKSAEAAYRQARATVQVARAALFPTVNFAGSAQRSATGQGNAPGGGQGGTVVTNLFNVALGASWEVDIWGKIRRTVESNVANAQASAADLALARLSLQATLATDYFELRSADELSRLLDATVVAYTHSLEITRNQYNAGFASRADVVSADTQLKTTQALAINVGVQRAQLEHAIAVLIGKPPADLTIKPVATMVAVPSIPAGLPSTLLERRPDIAAAERTMAAANAQIGVAVAAYYPDLTLSATYGYSSSVLGKLLNAPFSYWSFGPQLAETLFDAGARSGQVEAARAAYQQAVANYRETVLTSFQQVEDSLAALRILAQQAEAEDAAVRLAQESERLQLNQYRAGTVAYTNVLVAQATALSDEQTALTIRENRLVASATLIEALGGGWTASELPNTEQVEQGMSVFSGLLPPKAEDGQ